MRYCLITILAAALAAPSLVSEGFADNGGGTGSAPASAKTALPGEKPLSERVVAYTIEAQLDVEKKTLDADEVLRYQNLTGRALDTFPFHLYLNAFQPKATFMQEVHRDSPSYKWDPKYYGAIEIRSLSADGVGDLTSQIRFVHPDDDNTDDRTVFEVKLPRPVAPGSEITFHMKFHDQFPEILARTGYHRDFFMGAQWFPKVGVWWQGAWNCHQFHETTEFFADFGTFDVKLTLPQNYVTGASGVEIASTTEKDGTKTVVWHAQDIHDFAWTASPNFKVYEDWFVPTSAQSLSGQSAGPVRIRLLISPSHESQAQLHLDALKGAMKRFDDWYGPYPYPQITVIDPPRGASRAGGMEYPTLITAGTAWYIPSGVRAVADVIVHEFGHQYWYGMVATNEFENAWLDEGINSYTEAKILDDMYGTDTSAVQFAGAAMGDDEFQRMQYQSAYDVDPIAQPAWFYLNRNTYGSITYGKTATVLLTLEKLVGEKTMRQALRTYFLRYQFRHPTQEDFLKTIEEVAGSKYGAAPSSEVEVYPGGKPDGAQVSGNDLHWFLDRAVYGTSVLDYEVLSARSSRRDWFESEPSKEKKNDIIYRTDVVLHRKGDFVFPVELEVKFDNGETVHESWDGHSRWHRFSFDKPAKLVSAEIDHGHNVGLDHDFFNNSFVADANRGPRFKLATYWMILTQWFAQLLSWLA
jgi:hypothetical protein